MLTHSLSAALSISPCLPPLPPSPPLSLSLSSSQIDFFSQKGAKRAYMLKRFMRCAPAYYLAILGGWAVWLKYQTGLFTGEDEEGGFVDRVNEYGVIKNMLIPEVRRVMRIIEPLSTTKPVPPYQTSPL